MLELCLYLCAVSEMYGAIDADNEMQTLTDLRSLSDKNISDYHKKEMVQELLPRTDVWLLFLRHFSCSIITIVALFYYPVNLYMAPILFIGIISNYTKHKTHKVGLIADNCICTFLYVAAAISCSM